jgi:hypothetical protein
MKALKFGDKAKPVAIEKFQGVPGINDVIAVISESQGIFAPITHYMPGIGSFHCFEGKCCEMDTRPSLRYVLPVVHYKITDYSKLERGLPVELKYLSLGKKAYEHLITIAAINGGIDKVDLVVSTDTDRYKTMSFTPCQGKPVWRTTPQIVEVVRKEFGRYMALIEQSIGRTFTKETFEVTLQALQAASAEDSGRNATAGPAVPPPPPVTSTDLIVATNDQSTGDIVMEAEASLDDLMGEGLSLD